MLVAAGAALVSAACGVLEACGGGVSSPGVPPEMKHSWEVAFNRGDSAAVAALYSSNAELVMSGAGAVRGQADIRTAVDRMIRSGVKVRIGSAQNVGSGDLSYVYGGYSVFERDGGREIERGTYLEVWRRRVGAWKIDLDVNAAGPPIPPAVSAHRAAVDRSR
jgi:ketosteroid isomerase-like protein